MMNTQKKTVSTLQPSVGTPRFRRLLTKYGPGVGFLLPFFVLFFVFTILPVFTAVGMSLTYYDLINPPRFTGLTNFVKLLLEDDVFLISLRNTFVFAAITGPIGYVLSFASAWIIDQFRARNALALVFYAPTLVTATAISVVWLYLFSGDRYGLINNVLLQLAVINEPIQWTTNPATIMPVIIIVQLWMSMGNGFLVFLAGFKNISPEIYEAGAIDGVKNRTQQLFMLTLPMMKPQLLYGAITSIVSAFAVFDIAVSIAGMPSPDYAAHTIVAHLYDHAFIRFEMGYASGIAVILFLITYLLGQLCMRLLSSKEE